MFHFSTVTHQPEICTASSPATCKYANGFHSEDWVEVQAYADKENEMLSKLTEFQAKYFLSNQMTRTDTSHLLVKNRSEGYTTNGSLITNDTLAYLGFTKEEQDKILSYDDCYIIPKTERAIQRFMYDPKNLNYMFNELQEGFEKGEVGNAVNGRAYIKTEVVPYIDYAVMHPGTNVMGKVIDSRNNVAGPWGYTLAECWENYIKIKEKNKSLYYANKHENSFYVVCCNKR